jgi:rhodanese-related sulfurtransferase
MALAGWQVLPFLAAAFRLMSRPFGRKNKDMHRGDIPPAEAYQRLTSNPNAVLVDVRTDPEWSFVGVPAVERLIQLSWQEYPAMRVNPNFVGEIERTGLPKDTEFLFICRSGARSAAAAAAMTRAGYDNCWNVAEGFEGNRDAEGHRATVGGWKAAGLPWVQS